MSVSLLSVFRPGGGGGGGPGGGGGGGGGPVQSHAWSGDTDHLAVSHAGHEVRVYSRAGAGRGAIH